MQNTFLIENNEEDSNNQINTVLGHYNHQVGGHSTILSNDNKILKPLIHREYQFYQYISNFKIFHNFLMSPFLPRFFGSIDILKSSSSNGSNEVETSRDGENNNNVNNKKKIKSSNKHPIGTKKQYIMLEDITVNYKKPCIVDIKIGTRQRGVVCSTTTSTSHGVRICGMKLYKENFGYIVFDRYIGRSLNPDSLENLLLNFFSISSHMQDQINLINSILEKLNGIKNILSNEKDQFPFKIYSSSLLIVYEGCQNNDSSDVMNNIGFDGISYVNSSNNSSSSSLFSTSSETSSSLLSSTGSDSEHKQSKETLSSTSSPTIHLNGADVDSILNSGSVSSSFSSSSNSTNNSNRNSSISSGSSGSSSSGLDALSEILSKLSTGRSSFSSPPSSPTSNYNSEFDVSSSISTSEENSGFNSRCSSPDITCPSSDSTSTSNPIKNDVKMIDFAHAIPFSDIQESSDDDGYVFGIQNLINILTNIRYKLLQPTSSSTQDSSLKSIIDDNKIATSQNQTTLPISIPQI